MYAAYLRGFIFFLVVIHLTGGTKLRQCPGNDLQGRHMCNCHEGNAIEQVTSKFDRYHKDRIWNISCSTSSLYAPKSPRCEDLTTKWTNYKTNFDFTFKSHGYSCLFKHGVMTGWESEFDTRTQDRRYRFTYTIPHMWGVVVNSCRTRKISSFETQGHFTVTQGQVINGLKSEWNSKYNDREWSIKVCKISRECDIIKDITFSKVEDPAKFLTYAEITRESQVTDATGHTGDIEAELTMSSETSKSLTETERFESTSESTVSHTASVSVTATIEVPFVTMQVEGGYEFQSERMTSKTWSRETTTEYTETNGKEMEWQYICHAGTRCEAVVSVYQAVVKVPYTMKVGSSSSMETCTERGIYERVQTFTKFHVTSTIPTTTSTTAPTTRTTTSTTTTTKPTTTTQKVEATTKQTTKIKTTTAKPSTASTTIMQRKTTIPVTSPKSQLRTHKAPLAVKGDPKSTVSSIKLPSKSTSSEELKVSPTAEPVDTRELTETTVTPLLPNSQIADEITDGSVFNDSQSNSGNSSLLNSIYTQENTEAIEGSPATERVRSGIVLKEDMAESSGGGGERHLEEDQATSPLVDDDKNNKSPLQPNNNNTKSSLTEDNLTTKQGMNTGTLKSGKEESVLQENIKHGAVLPKPVDCKDQQSVPSLCQQIYGCVNGVPAAAKITAYMFAMAMSVAFAMKLSTALMT